MQQLHGGLISRSCLSTKAMKLFSATLRCLRLGVESSRRRGAENAESQSREVTECISLNRDKTERLKRRVWSVSHSRAIFTPVPGWRNGRRCGLKIRCPKGRAGSTPALGTNSLISRFKQHGTRSSIQTGTAAEKHGRLNAGPVAHRIENDVNHLRSPTA